MRFYLKKFFEFILTLFLVTLVTFFAFQILPGNPAVAILGPDADEIQIANLESELGLDKSPFIRYGEWLKKIFRGDFGTSYKYSKSVSKVVADAFAATFSLAIFSLILSAIWGIAFGIFIALKEKNPLAFAGFKSNLDCDSFILRRDFFDNNFLRKTPRVSFDGICSVETKSARLPSHAFFARAFAFIGKRRDSFALFEKFDSRRTKKRLCQNASRERFESNSNNFCPRFAKRAFARAYDARTFDRGHSRRLDYNRKCFFDSRNRAAHRHFDFFARLSAFANTHALSRVNHRGLQFFR